MLSVIIPTHQRREHLMRTLDALAAQHGAGTDVEVVVVVDGSTDGTAAAVHQRALPTPLRVVEQPRGGLAAARNRGARAAAGELLLFLDDDMVCHPDYLRQVVTSFNEGADVVLTRLRLGAWVPPGALRDEYAAWLDEGHEELLAGAPSVHNIVFGATAIRRKWFERVGRFDEVFTAGGQYGAEDCELGHRLLKAGAVFSYQPGAVVHTGCETDPRKVLARDREVGRNHVRLVRTHPELLDTLLGAPYRDSRLHRAVGPVVRSVPAVARAGALLRPAAQVALARASGAAGPPRLWRLARALAHWRGVTEAGGAPLARRALAGVDRQAGPGRRLRSVRVLAYHAVANLDHEPALAEYAVTLEQFRGHLDALDRLGVRWMTLDHVLEVLAGRRPAPRRAVLLTFDDGYADNAAAADELARRGIPAVLFAVSGHIGGASSWIDGARPQPLLTLDELHVLTGKGFEIGSHSRSHADLLRTAAGGLREEVAGSAVDLAGADLPARAFAYPYGRHDGRVHAAVRAAGYQAGFTVDPGVLRAGGDPFRIPRIEVHRQDHGVRFLLKVASAGRSPAWEAWAHHHLGWLKPAWRAGRRLRAMVTSR